MLSKMFENVKSGAISATKQNAIKTQAKRDLSLDFMKGLAIIAVVTEHTGRFFQSKNAHVINLTFFCVSLFIIIAGYNSYNSYKRKMKENRLSFRFYDTKDLWKYLSPLLFSYAICVAVVQIVETRFLDMGLFWERFIQFGKGSPLYYLAILFSLMLIRQPICAVIYKVSERAAKHRSPKSKVFKNAFFATILALSIPISWLFFNYSYIPFSATKWPNCYIFGASYFSLFIFGIIFASLLENVEKMLPIRLFGGGLFLMSLALYVINYPNHFQINPPGLMVCLYAISIFLLLIKLPFKNRVSEKFAKVVAIYGKYSWPIYLYHFIIILLITKAIKHYDFMWTYQLTGASKYLCWAILFLTIPIICILGKKIQLKMKQVVVSDD